MLKSNQLLLPALKSKQLLYLLQPFLKSNHSSLLEPNQLLKHMFKILEGLSHSILLIFLPQIVPVKSANVIPLVT